MISVLFLTLGLVLLGLSIGYSRHAAVQAQWACAPGTVIRSEVENRFETFAVVVRYGYEVDALKFVGDTVRCGALQYNWSAPVRRASEKYPVGASVTVYDDPKSPGMAVLELGGSNATLVSIFVATVVCFLVSAISFLA